MLFKLLAIVLKLFFIHLYFIQFKKKLFLGKEKWQGNVKCWRFAILAKKIFFQIKKSLIKPTK